MRRPEADPTRAKDGLVVGTAVRWAHDLGSGEDTGSLYADLTALLTDKARTLDGPGGRLPDVLIGESAQSAGTAPPAGEAMIAELRPCLPCALGAVPA